VTVRQRHTKPCGLIVEVSSSSEAQLPMEEWNALFALRRKNPLEPSRSQDRATVGLDADPGAGRALL
jgi:hypothetical protein